ncbi:MAG: PepSY domain-containing protein [Gammaproteobacteria bacterium]
MKSVIKLLVLMLLISQPSWGEANTLMVRISLDQATKKIIGNGRNRILGAQTAVIDGREVHIIKVLTPDGRIQYFKIDAETGAVIG